MGGNSKTESARVVSLARDTPTGRPLYNVVMSRQSD